MLYSLTLTQSQLLLPAHPLTHVNYGIVLQEASSGKDGKYEYGICAMQGWRTDMVSWSLECWF